MARVSGFNTPPIGRWVSPGLRSGLAPRHVGQPVSSRANIDPRGGWLDGGREAERGLFVVFVGWVVYPHNLARVRGCRRCRHALPVGLQRAAGNGPPRLYECARRSASGRRSEMCVGRTDRLALRRRTMQPLKKGAMQQMGRPQKPDAYRRDGVRTNMGQSVAEQPRPVSWRWEAVGYSKVA